MISLRGRGRFLSLFGSSVVSQAVLSLASLLVGLILIRRQSDAQYGYYVLVTVTLLLFTGFQGAFIQPSMVIYLARHDETARRDLIGGLFREQRKFVLLTAGLTALLICGLWAGGLLEPPLALLALAAVIAAVCALFREFFRMVLLSYQRPIEVLACDVIYVFLLVPGAFLATFSPLPAATAVLTLSVAAAIGGTLLARAMWRHEPWKIDGAQGILREIAPLGAWAVSGSGVHWAFSQGATYMVAAMLDVQAVAAIAATRLLVMPVNLLSTGMLQMMLPTASRWLHLHGAVRLYGRLLRFCAAMTILIICYFGIMWAVRDWIFANILKKQFTDRDALLFFWCLICLFMMLRDQLASLLVVSGKLRQMSTLTLVSATLALTASYLFIRQFGVTGALIGVLIGEVVNVTGIVVLSTIESKRPVNPP